MRTAGSTGAGCPDAKNRRPPKRGSGILRDLQQNRAEWFRFRLLPRFSKKTDQLLFSADPPHAKPGMPVCSALQIVKKGRPLPKKVAGAAVFPFLDKNIDRFVDGQCGGPLMCRIMMQFLAIIIPYRFFFVKKKILFRRQRKTGWFRAFLPNFKLFSNRYQHGPESVLKRRFCRFRIL